MPAAFISEDTEQEVTRILERARSVPRYKASRERDALIEAIDCQYTTVARGL